jgi:hypothetical protein
MQPLYNKEGRAVAYIADNKVSIYFYDGTPAAWIYQESLVFAYSGRFLGWLMYGWLCDPRGNPAFFTERSIGGPKRAPLRPRPMRAPRGARPPRRQRQLPPPGPRSATRPSSTPRHRIRPLPSTMLPAKSRPGRRRARQPRRRAESDPNRPGSEREPA